jgi:hypothetical protein
MGVAARTYNRLIVSSTSKGIENCAQDDIVRMIDEGLWNFS